jgi:hypothetical protein
MSRETQMGRMKDTGVKSFTMEEMLDRAKKRGDTTEIKNIERIMKKEEIFQGKVQAIREGRDPKSTT